MLDHIFLTVEDTGRSIAIYERVLPVLGITTRSDFVGKGERVKLQCTPPGTYI